MRRRVPYTRQVARSIELRRHTDNEGDVLTSPGVDHALELGARLRGRYHVAVSSGAQRATQTLGCFLAALETPVPGGVIVEPRLRSGMEDRWRSAYAIAGAGDLEALRNADADLVAEDSARLADGLRAVLDLLQDGQTALVVGHSPTNEAAVYGLTGTVIKPQGKGENVCIVAESDGFRVESVD